MTLISILCPVCGKSREVDMPDEFALVRVALCEPCADRHCQTVALPVKDSWEERWREICPKEFRLIQEGGTCDWQRLTRVQPKGVEVIGWSGESNLALVGKTGGCKTRLAWRLVRGFHDLRQSYACFTAYDFQAAAQSAGGQYRLDDWSRELVKLDLFFLDDLGKAPWTENTWAAFFYVVDQRIAHGKPILITTNFVPGDLERSLNAKGIPMLKEMAAPLLRRIKESFQSVTMEVMKSL